MNVKFRYCLIENHIGLLFIIIYCSVIYRDYDLRFVPIPFCAPVLNVLIISGRERR